MQQDQTSLPHTADSTDNSDAFISPATIHTQLHDAVEDRNYRRIQDLVVQQREVFERAGARHAEAPLHARLARDLAIWALTMVRLQRAHDQRALFELVAFKTAHESYQPRPGRSFDCLVEG